PLPPTVDGVAGRSCGEGDRKDSSSGILWRYPRPAKDAGIPREKGHEVPSIALLKKQCRGQCRFKLLIPTLAIPQIDTITKNPEVRR
ncbi:MAG: hypothetical protein V2A78_06325, partial [bacterium]